MPVDFSIKWDKDSERWIDGLEDRFGDALITGLSLAFKSGMSWAYKTSRSNVPVFESWAKDSLHLFGFKSDRNSVRMSLGFTSSRIFVDDSDVVADLHPFNYAWTKESSENTESHIVCLYNPRTGGSTKNRKKLVRWMKQHGTGKPDWSKLPTAPTAEFWNKKRTKDERLNFPPPFVRVSPEKTATDFITGLYKDHGDPLMRKILEDRQLTDAITVAWEF